MRTPGVELMFDWAYYKLDPGGKFSTPVPLPATRFVEHASEAPCAAVVLVAVTKSSKLRCIVACDAVCRLAALPTTCDAGVCRCCPDDGVHALAAGARGAGVANAAVLLSGCKACRREVRRGGEAGAGASTCHTRTVQSSPHVATLHGSVGHHATHVTSLSCPCSA